ncbi:MAG: ATP-binding protein [Burkholderiaceae bacterium]
MLEDQNALMRSAISLFADIDSAHQSIISASMTAAQLASDTDAVLWYKSLASVEASMESARRAVGGLLEQMPERRLTGRLATIADAPGTSSPPLKAPIKLDATSVMCLLDESVSFRYISPCVQELLGMRSFVLLDRPLVEMASQETQEELSRAIDNATAAIGQAQQCEFQALTQQTGRYLWVQLTITAIAGEDGPSSFLGVMRDIDERKRFEHEIRYLSAMTSASRDLIAFVDRRYIYRYANESFTKYWEMDDTKIIGSSVADLFGLEVFFRQMRPVFDRVFSGSFETVVEEVDLPASGKRFFEVNYLPARMANGTIEGAVVLLHDIDAHVRRERDLTNAKASLEATNESLQQFVRIASHDLKEPLNTITNFAGLLFDECGETIPPAGQEYLGYVQAGAGRLQVLMRDLLSFSRLESIDAELSDIALEPLLIELKQSMHDAIEKAGARIVHGPLPVVRGYRPLLVLLLQNLLGNAIKFRREDAVPVITVTCRQMPEEGTWQITVSDNGIGIPPRFKDDVFKIFRRLHTRNEYEGTGLGLAICRKVAELHRGTITTEPGESNGTRIVFELPRNPAQVEPIEVEIPRNELLSHDLHQT